MPVAPPPNVTAGAVGHAAGVVVSDRSAAAACETAPLPLPLRAPLTVPAPPRAAAKVPLEILPALVVSVVALAARPLTSPAAGWAQLIALAAPHGDAGDPLVRRADRARRVGRQRADKRRHHSGGQQNGERGKRAAMAPDKAQNTTH
jgi:hypothetical protein